MTLRKRLQFFRLKRMQRALNRAFEKHGGADKSTQRKSRRFLAFAKEQGISGEEYYQWLERKKR